MLLLLACTLHTSSVHGLESGGDAAQSRTPRPEADCQWVLVDESRTTKLFALTLGVWTRQYDESLFYCCPSVTGQEPVCWPADWTPTAAAPLPAVPMAAPPGAELTTTMVYAILGRQVDTGAAAWSTDVAFVGRAMAAGHTQEEILTATQLGVQKLGTGREVSSTITAGLVGL